ncbi:uncharacterized protein METZ01_LOCUS421508, partial [marine metagenome]
ENPCVGGSIPPRATFKTLEQSRVFWYIFKHPQNTVYYKNADSHFNIFL